MSRYSGLGDGHLLSGSCEIAVPRRSLEGQEARALSVELALSDASAVGIEGRTFSLLVCTNEPDFEGDGVGRGDATAALGAYLEELGVVAIVGPPSSSDVQRIVPATSAPLLISPSATSNALTDLDPVPASDMMPGRFWRTAAPDTQQGIRIAEDLIARAVPSLALGHADDARRMLHRALAHLDSQDEDDAPALDLEEQRTSIEARLEELTGEAG